MTDQDSVLQQSCQQWAIEAQAQIVQGRVAARIPRLGEANPSWFSGQILGFSKIPITVGNFADTFPLMSVIKPFVLLYQLEQVGQENVLQSVGLRPSDAPFNSKEQLMADQGFPRNPMINSGAIALIDKLSGTTATQRCQQVCDWLNQQADCQFALDRDLLASVRTIGREPNIALVEILQHSGAVTSPEITLDAYEQLCCLSGRINDLACLGQLFATPQAGIAEDHRQIVNAVMLTCGLYERSSEMAVHVGLPMKSGISGALLAIVPGKGSIACYSPALDSYGNSVAGLVFIDRCVKHLNLSIFQ